ncbi:hypothetical protein AALO_G00260580 [Alosa alosa]|uniref:Nucleoporin-like protein 2 n=1 Tax=Alosa alosa TaxID=278164 RepID=A0AAV6FTD0_9TELE|nr:hypothetical protein AALO_G00260580 [Alosa alosa]
MGRSAGTNTREEAEAEGAAGGGDYSRGTPQSNRGGGGFGNRVWVNPQRAGGDFVKPTNFGGRENAKNSSFGVPTQNRFGTLNTPSSFDRGGHKDENDKHLETIQKDMEIWESSGQWLFSCYSVLKGSVSGFVELSPEELRLEYYNGRASGDLQAYGSSVQQLASQWRNRLQELKVMNANTRSTLIAELNNPGQQPSSFGSAPSGFGSSSAGFGSTAPPSGFGSTAPSGFGAAPSGFGSAPASGFGSAGFGAPAQNSANFSFAPTQSAAPTGFGSAQPPSQSGFGSAPGTAPSASSFSFAAPAAAAATKDASSGFGASASGFSFASSAPLSTSGFGGVLEHPPGPVASGSPASAAPTVGFLPQRGQGERPQ